MMTLIQAKKKKKFLSKSFAGILELFISHIEPHLNMLDLVLLVLSLRGRNNFPPNYIVPSLGVCYGSPMTP
jgi:hypothetical protein